MASDDNSEQMKLDATQARKALQSLIKQAQEFNALIQKSGNYGAPGFAKFQKEISGALKSVSTQLSGFRASLTTTNQKINEINASVGASFLRTGTAVNKLATQYKQVEAAIAGVAKVRTGLENVSGITKSSDALAAYQRQVEAVRRSYAEMQASRKLGDSAAIANFEKLQTSAADLLNTYRNLQNVEKEEAATAKKASAEKQAAIREEIAARREQARAEAQFYREQNASAAGAFRANMAARRYNQQQLANNIPVVAPVEGAGAKIARQASTFANYAILGAALGGTAATLSEVAKLDSALHNLQGITQTSDAGMAKLRGTILQVAAGSRFMASEVADAATVLGQAGLSTQQIQDSLKGVVVFAQAAGIKLEESVNLLTSATSAFNLRADQTEDVANVFTAALNKSKLTIQQLSQGFQYSASAAAQSGVSFRELTVIMELLAQAGIKSGSMIGTGTRQIINQLAAPNAKFRQILLGLNLSLDDINLKQHSLITVTETLKKAGFDAADAFQAFGTRGASAFIALSSQIDKAADFTAGLNDSKAAANAAAKQMEGFSATLKRFMSAIGAAAATGLDPLVRGLQAIIGVSADAIGALNNIGPAIQLVATGLALFAGAKAGLYIANITGIAQAIRLMAAESVATNAISAMLGGISILLNPMALTIGALTIAITAATYAWNAHKVAVAANAEAYDNANSKYNTAHQTSVALAAATQDLLNKQNDLKSGSPELAAKMAELGGQFQKLGLDVNQLNNNYDQLLNRMRQLRGVALLQETNALMDARQKNLAVYGDQRGATEAALFGLQGSRGLGIGNSLFSRYDASGLNIPSITAIRRKFAKVGSRPTEADLGSIFAAAASADAQGPGLSAANQSLLKDLHDALLAFANAAKTEFSTNRSIRDQGNTIAALRLRNSGQLPGFETDTENLIARIRQGKPRNVGDDPVRYAADVNAWMKMGTSQLQTRMDATRSFAGSDAIRQAAVRQIQDEISQALADLNVEATTSNNAAKSQRAALANYMKKKVELALQAAQAEMQNATNETDLKAAYGKVKGLTTQLFSAAADAAAAEMGLKIGDYSTAGGKLTVTNGKVTATNRIKIDEFNLDNPYGQAKVDQEYITKRRSLMKGLISGANSGDRTVAAADTRAIQVALSNYLRDVTDQFKSLDKYAPTSVVKEHAAAALQDIQQWYLQSMDLIEKELERGIKALPDKDPNREEHVKDLQNAAEDKRDALRESRDARIEEINNRKQDILNDPRARLPANMNEAYENIAQAVEDPRKTKYQTDEFATVFQDSMISAIDTVKSSFGELWASIFDGTKTAGQAFSQFARGILSSMAEVVGNYIAKQFLKMILSLAGNAFGGSIGGGAEVGPGGDDGFGGWAGMATGGMVSKVRGGIPTRDSVPTLVPGGSFILRQSVASKLLRRAGGGMVPTLLQPGELAFSPGAVSALGEKTLRRMNAGGLINGSIGMGTPTDELRGAAHTAMKGREPSHTNVWVVKPDQQPQMTKNDVLVTITEDILANGQTKKMIKSVVNGG